MRPKARRREQGTEVKLRPLRLNTTEGALKKEARFNSTANGDGRSRRARSRESSAGPASQRTEPDRTEVKGNPTSSKEARRAT